jgi:UDP-N-acetyl-D-glucosamine dehydrogenase
MVEGPVKVADVDLIKDSALLQKLDDRTAHIGVVGLGYVGLPTMLAVAEGGFRVTGLDIDESRITRINAGESYIEDIHSSMLGELVSGGKISATSDFSVVADLDVVLVCVPTPLTKNRQPDLIPMESAINSIAENMQGEQLIVLQSTTYPGTTEEFVLPRLEKKGRKVGEDFYLAFALERIDPGNMQSLLKEVPKVVGGADPRCTQMATAFFSTFLASVVPVSSPRVAEMTKLLENIFRSVNIALVNELSMLCRRMEIDIWEVINAASTKPFGYMAFYPGPGVGGHCIPVDPFYLSWKANEYDFYVNFIQLAAEINDNMPYYTVSRIAEILDSRQMPLSTSKLLICGVTFKENIGDIRNSPAVQILGLLMDRGAEVHYADNNAPNLEIKGHQLSSKNLDPQSLDDYDAVIVMVNHSYFDLDEIVENSSLLIDTRNATQAYGDRDNIAKL